MNIGEFKSRISIEAPTISVNDNGFKTEAYAVFCKAWAKVENLHGREFFQAQQVNSSASVKFTIRYVPGISSDMRLNYRGKLYNIIYLDNIRGLNKYIEILCEVTE